MGEWLPTSVSLALREEEVCGEGGERTTLMNSLLSGGGRSPGGVCWCWTGWET